MYLCHKCCGTFEIHEHLQSCCCISGYYRGFEKDLTLKEAVEAQHEQIQRNLRLYARQGRKLTDRNVQIELDNLYNILIAMNSIK